MPRHNAGVSVLGALGPVARWRTYLQAADLLLDPVLGLMWALLFAILLLIGLIVAPTLIGLSVLGEVIIVARAAMGLERGRARILLGVKVDTPPAQALPPGWWARCRVMLADRAGWRAIGYPFILCLSGILGFAAAAVWAAGIAGFLYPVWRWLWPVQAGSSGALTSAAEIAAICAGGLIITIAGAWLVSAAASADAALIRKMLGPSAADLSRRIEHLQASRVAAVSQAAAERRRIERDLHDGIQARLIALAMDLGMARQRLEAESRPSPAAALVAQAHEEAIRAADELRDIARGVHPAVLTDRGLDAALSALIARGPVPVDVNVQLPARPPPAVEAIAYFVIAEALTNIAKHSNARQASVTVREAGETLFVTVTDDGGGGAHRTEGGGLAGLEERLAGVDGRLTVTSPAGGPTVILAEVPCGS